MRARVRHNRNNTRRRPRLSRVGGSRYTVRSITPEDIIRDATREVGSLPRRTPAGFAGEFIADKFGLDRERSWHKTRFGCQQKYKSFIKDKEPPSRTLHFTVITIEAEFIYENNK